MVPAHPASSAGRLGAVQSLDLGLLVHAQHDRLVRRFRYRPTTSVSFSSKRLSLESLKVSTRCGCSPRPPDPLHRGQLTPCDLAIDRQLQCVSPCGLSCSVACTIAATFSAPIESLRPRPSRTRRTSPAHRRRTARATPSRSPETPRALPRSPWSPRHRRPAAAPSPASPPAAAPSATAPGSPGPLAGPRSSAGQSSLSA